MRGTLSIAGFIKHALYLENSVNDFSSTISSLGGRLIKNADISKKYNQKQHVER